VLESKLFDSLVISAAASHAKHHAKWVDKIDFSDQIYITINQNDKLLGKGITSILGNAFIRSAKANYIDITKYKLNHRYYLHRDLIGKSKIKSFYNDVLNGMLPGVE